jgi:hypothetical protein
VFPRIVSFAAVDRYGSPCVQAEAREVENEVFGSVNHPSTKPHGTAPVFSMRMISWFRLSLVPSSSADGLKRIRLILNAAIAGTAENANTRMQIPLKMPSRLRMSRPLPSVAATYACLIDCEEDWTLRAVLVGMLRETAMKP